MLEAFLKRNRDAILARAKAQEASGDSPRPTSTEVANGTSVFLDQLEEALRVAEAKQVADHKQLNETASRHGRDLQGMGLTIRQVVHDYGDLCQVITALALREDQEVPGGEFQTLSLCLDDAIAEAVAEYSRQRELQIVSEEAERLGVLSHELRGLLNTAMIAYDILKSGRVPLGGSTGLVLGRSLLGLRNLIDLSLADVRLDADTSRVELIQVAGFVQEVESEAVLHAQARGLRFTVPPVDPVAIVEGDRNILAAAVSNLLQNAFKFSHEGGGVSLTTRVTIDRVRFEIEDECGGLPPGRAEELFRPFEQRGSDHSGVGLGLSICRKAARAAAGEICIQNLPGKGCIFTLDLPRSPPKPPAEVMEKAHELASAADHPW
jgi:signal transduction histidine kinase